VLGIRGLFAVHPVLGAAALTMLGSAMILSQPSVQNALAGLADRIGDLFSFREEASDLGNEEDDVAPGTLRNPDGSVKEPGQQFEEVEAAKARGDRGKGPKIERTGKSRQRDRAEIDEAKERALEELRRRRGGEP
jgi:hypothetical protein